MASGATNIDDLPSGDKPNVTLETQDKPVQPNNTIHTQNQSQPQVSQLSQNDINKIISGIQSASQHNLTSLPSRDIPMETIQQQTDNQIQANYVPDNNKDYIKQEDTAQTIYEKHLAKQKNKIRQEEIYDELQTPVMIMILFLLFQLPMMNKTLFKYIPSLFIKDGSMSFGGHIFKSLLFGASYYIIMKLINYLSDV